MAPRAARHSAEPATGEATLSGPGTITLNDGGAGVGFNFPGAARFRPIAWDEWFENFERHQLALPLRKKYRIARMTSGKLVVAGMGMTATTGSKRSISLAGSLKGPVRDTD